MMMRIHVYWFRGYFTSSGISLLAIFNYCSFARSFYHGHSYLYDIVMCDVCVCPICKILHNSLFYLSHVVHSWSAADMRSMPTVPYSVYISECLPFTNCATAYYCRRSRHSRHSPERYIAVE